MQYVCLMYPADTSRKDSKIKWEVAESRPFEKVHERNTVSWGEAGTYETASKQMLASIQKLTGRK